MFNKHSSTPIQEEHLQLLHGSDIGGLDVVLILLDLALELVERDLLVLNDQVDLELLDTETDGDELVSTPDEAVHLDGLDVGNELVHVGLIICQMVSLRSKIQKVIKHTPRLDIHGDNGLSSRLGLALLLLLVLSQSPLTLSNDLGVLLLRVRAEEILVLVLLSSGSGLGVDGHLGLLRAVGSVGLGGVARKSGELSLVGGDVLVPTGSIGELGGVRSGAESLEAGNIGLRRTGANWSVSFEFSQTIFEASVE